jgi:hypothetical protein
MGIDNFRLSAGRDHESYPAFLVKNEAIIPNRAFHAVGQVRVGYPDDAPSLCPCQFADGKK